MTSSMAAILFSHALAFALASAPSTPLPSPVWASKILSTIYFRISSSSISTGQLFRTVVPGLEAAENRADAQPSLRILTAAVSGGDMLINWREQEFKDLDKHWQAIKIFGSTIKHTNVWSLLFSPLSCQPKWYTLLGSATR